jgi:hypothetical protein
MVKLLIGFGVKYMSGVVNMEGSQWIAFSQRKGLEWPSQVS